MCDAPFYQLNLAQANALNVGQLQWSGAQQAQQQEFYPPQSDLQNVYTAPEPARHVLDWTGESTGRWDRLCNWIEERASKGVREI